MLSNEEIQSSYLAHIVYTSCPFSCTMHLCSMSTFRYSRMGWEALIASLPSSSNIHLIDIFVVCRPKLPPIGALDTVDQASSSALLSVRWDTGFCILIQDVITPLCGRFESHHHHKGRALPIYFTSSICVSPVIQMHICIVLSILYIYISALVCCCSHTKCYTLSKLLGIVDFPS